MTSFAQRLSLIALASSLGTPTLAQQPQPIPSHCKSGEFALLNAHLSRVVRPQGGTVAYALIKTGKIVSLCADRRQEPFRSVAYRFGPAGQVELERIASAAQPFSLHTRSTTPRSGENLIFFKNQAFTYYVSEATGMGSGISVIVFRSGQKLLNLFSGNSPGTDFNSQLDAVNFERAGSPVFTVSTPADRF